MTFVKLADKEAYLGSHYTFERQALRSDNIYENPAGAERGGNFQADKASADNYHSLR